MEILNNIWVLIITLIGKLSLDAILLAILYGVLRGRIEKSVAKINAQKIADDAVEKGIKKVERITFNHNIQPLVESSLEKQNEKSVEVVKDTLAKVDDQYNKVINILEKLGAYFDDSIGVSENAKKELKEAIQDAKVEIIKVESHIEPIEEPKIEEPKKETKPLKSRVER